MLAEHDRIDAVLLRYPAEYRRRGLPQPNAAGLSGAMVWRIETSDVGSLALRRWPPEHPTAARLEWIAQIIRRARQAGCGFVPVPLVASGGRSTVAYGDTLWQLEPWMPGAPLSDSPSKHEVELAFAALARFHAAVRRSSADDVRSAVSPALRRRRDVFQKCRTIGRQKIGAALRQQEIHDCWRPLAEEAESYFDLFDRHAGACDQLLQLSERREVELQPVAGDLHAEHVLFENGRVSGLIDFGAMTIDNVALDLARLLGSLVGDDLGLETIALNAYDTQLRAEGQPLSVGLSIDERVLVRAFDRSGALLSPYRWLCHVFVDRREFADPAAVIGRWRRFMARLRRWT